jgi:hypothetical protein
MAEAITARQAARIMVRALEARGITGVTCKGRTVDFTDLARASRVFVRLHGWQTSEHGRCWDELAAIARSHNFSLEA